MAFGILAIFMAGCQSKEEKAEEFIRNNLSKTLYDFESYQPIETTVTEAKLTMYNDTTCLQKGAMISYTLEKGVEYLDASKDAQERMEIWGRPSAYSSSYSDSKYYEYKKEYEENLEKGINAYNICKTIAAELKKHISELDTSKVIGWEARQRFRCKTKGGNSTIGDYRYIIDKDFKTVYHLEDMDSKTDSDIRSVLKSVINGEFEE